MHQIVSWMGGAETRSSTTKNRFGAELRLTATIRRNGVSFGEHWEWQLVQKESVGEYEIITKRSDPLLSLRCTVGESRRADSHQADRAADWRARVGNHCRERHEAKTPERVGHNAIRNASTT